MNKKIALAVFACAAILSLIGSIHLWGCVNPRDGSLSVLVHQCERASEPKAGGFVDCRGKELPASCGLKLERKYQDMVWGHSVTNQYILDAWGRLARRSPGIEPTDGCDVKMTVDADLQLKV